MMKATISNQQGMMNTEHFQWLAKLDNTTPTCSDEIPNSLNTSYKLQYEIKLVDAV